MKSKIVLGASLAIATLSLVSLVEIEGLSPFLIENVSANTHSANKVINHKVSIYLENADEGKGLTVNFSTDSVSPNLFDEFEKKSGITITTMLVNAKTGEVVEKRLTPSVFLRSNDLTRGTYLRLFLVNILMENINMLCLKETLSILRLSLNISIEENLQFLEYVIENMWSWEQLIKN
ncbi:TPA: hypothetical protein ACJ1ZF_000457 [Streptococcus pneumoniae]